MSNLQSKTIILSNHATIYKQSAVYSINLCINYNLGYTNLRFSTLTSQTVNKDSYLLEQQFKKKKNLDCYYLNDGHPRADVYQQVREDVWISCLEAELRVGMLSVHESLMGYVLQHKITALDEAGHLILFVNSATYNRELAQVDLRQMRDKP